MSVISDAIGSRFENYIDCQIKGLKKVSSGNNLPDFYCEDGKFWVEAKVGNIEWGPRIKQYQIDSFEKVGANVVYALGYHNFNSATQRLSGLSREMMDSLLDKEMEIKRVVFVNGDLISKLWQKENRTSKNGDIKYFMAKPSLFRNIWLQRKFNRFGEIIESAEDYYGISLDDFYIKRFDENGNKHGAILKLDEDDAVIKHLNSHSFLKSKFLIDTYDFVAQPG